MPDLLTAAANLLGLQADWRAATPQGGALPAGQPRSVEENIAIAEQLREQLGPQTYDVTTSARKKGSAKGGPQSEQATQRVEGITGQKGLTQNELAGIARYPGGQDLAQEVGPALATVMNAVYTADKALAQHRGQPQQLAGLLGLATPFGPTTSDASLENFLTAQAGIMSQVQNPMVRFIMDLLQGNVTGDRGPGAREQGGGSFIRG